MNVSVKLTSTPCKALLLLGCLVTALTASPRFNPNWSRLPAGTEIPELRTTTSRTFSNGDGTFTAEVHAVPTLPSYAFRPTAQSEAAESLVATNTGYIYAYNYHGNIVYELHGPDMCYYWQAGIPAASVCWAAFDVSGVPDSSQLLSVRYSWNQYELLAEDHAVAVVRLVRANPDTCSVEELFDVVYSGEITSAGQESAWLGWVTRDLAQNAIGYITEHLTDDRAVLGITQDPVQGWSGARIHGADGGEWAPYLTVSYLGPYETDIQAVHAELLTYPVVVGASQSDTALLVLTNRGIETSDYFWVYATSPGLSRESTLVGMIPVGETVSVRLPLPAPDSANTFVDYRLWSACLNDPWPANDTAHLRCWVFPHGTYAAEGFDEPEFPPAGWGVVNNDSGTKWWDHWTGGGKCHSGGGSAICVGEARNDDWLIGGPVFPTADDRDSLGFFRRSYNPSPPTALEVWAMRGSQVADTLRRLWTSSVADTAYSRLALSLDSLDGDTIWIGFRCRTSGTANALFLDDIWFSRVHVPGTCEPQGSVARQPELAFAPNPATSRFVTVQHSLAAGTRGRLVLRDVLGRTVKSFTLDPSGRARLDLRDFAPGVYMATLDATGQSVSRKLIITAR